MDPRKHHVSLRGSSTREITRNALLEKVSHERELRNFARRANAAALFIQRVWRRYNVTLRVALELQEEWNLLLHDASGLSSKTWISCCLLRPFLFFITHVFPRQHIIQTKAVSSMRSCFLIILKNIDSTDPNVNFCSLAYGSIEEQRTWNYQMKKLVSLCSFVLVKYDTYSSRSGDITAVTALLLRMIIILTDPKGWKCVCDETREDADRAVKRVIKFMGSDRSGLCRCVGKYMNKLGVPSPTLAVQRDENFLIIASAITLVLRPFQAFKMEEIDLSLDTQIAAEQYCLHILSVPWLVQRIPVVLVQALRHNSTLVPVLMTLMILHEKISVEYSRMDFSEASCPNNMPCAGWALANIISLATLCENSSTEANTFSPGLDIAGYVKVLNILAENLLTTTENNGFSHKEQVELGEVGGNSSGSVSLCLYLRDTTFGSISYIDLLKPICQQWHLLRLMAALGGSNKSAAQLSKMDVRRVKVLELHDITLLYSHMVRIYSFLNLTGSLPVLNMLAFTPGYLVSIWSGLECCFFPDKTQSSGDKFDSVLSHWNSSDRLSKKKQSKPNKDGAGKWANILQKISGKSPTDAESSNSFYSEMVDGQGKENIDDEWDIESLRCGLEIIPKERSCLIHLFCAVYAHLLLVLDDIEFYEKQFPFSLEQQRRIASMLNTLVYNGLLHNASRQNKPLLDAASRCLQMLYERDCRRPFCPSALWLSPAKKSRPPIALAARTHEVLSDFRSDDCLSAPSMGYFITVTPHVYPFEERVQMFREFINMDKNSRRMAGELNSPGDRSIAIVVRRGHLVEDGFQQLNSLGSRLKSSIHVSFVSESGLPEAGLDYGGLSKEFLTDIAKAAFDPQYGLFCQTSTSERLLIPNTAARFLENGVQMIEFLGKIVGKALYEGILLDYSFSHVFIQKLLGRYSFLDELSSLDPELYRNLMCVKNYEGDVEDLSLDFTITEELLGKRTTIELKPGGKDTNVTNDNKLQYIHAMADYKLNRQIIPLSNAFYRGLTDLISPSWLKLFNASEFNQLLSGGNHDIDVDDLRTNTRYTGGYSEGSRAVKLFWEVMAGFEPTERCMVLKFVTSCSRAPLLGFKHLQPTFTIHKVACDVPLWASIGGQDVERLPSASTCYNTLKLPTYKRASTLRSKLLYAINSNAGFELS
ncbi:hypothetical protein RND81_01G031600 [Saponaria officinalis]|uniref:HECT-type E3 ubiquitin transferase n=3 Tax=Saponaria officinalis TaxID=3572 RepID=A0AAW1N5S8_SAPOF